MQKIHGEIKLFTIEQDTSNDEDYTSSKTEIGTFEGSIQETSDKKVIGLGGVGLYTIVTFGPLNIKENDSILIKEQGLTFGVTRIKKIKRRNGKERIVLYVDKYEDEIA